MFDDNFDSIDSLVTGCPKLRVLHVGRRVASEIIIRSYSSAELARRLLLGLPNLIEFQHPAMVPALEQIIKDGKTERVSALRNLYIDYKLTYNSDRIIKLAASKLTCLTHLTMKGLACCTHAIVPTIKAVGHQLKLLNFSCAFSSELYNISDAINQCRELRILRIRLHRNGRRDPGFSTRNHWDDLIEEFTPFCYLQKLHLFGLNQPFLNLPLMTSLIASPLLQELELVSMPDLTDCVLQAAFNHTNYRGEQLAFTSLRKIKLKSCICVTTYSEIVFTDERVPLESLDVSYCRNLTDNDIASMNLERFQMDVINEYTLKYFEKERDIYDSVSEEDSDVDDYEFDYDP